MSQDTGPHTSETIQGSRGRSPPSAGRGGRRRQAPAAWIAWSLGICAAVLIALGLALAARSQPTRQYLYDNHLGNLLLALSFTPVGTLLALRRPANRISWLMCAIGALPAVALAADAAALFAAQEVDGAAGLSAWLAWIGHTAWFVGLSLIATFLLLLFPDGRPPSRRWRPVAWGGGGGLGLVILGVAVDPTLVSDMLPGIANPVAPPGAEPVSTLLQGAGGVVLFTCMFASMAALLLRLRRASGVERQQLKWFVYACGMAVASEVFAAVLQALGAEGSWVWVPLLVAVVSIPVSIGVAVLRYRLYDIDRIINRTLVYVLLTALLAGIYAGIVLVLGQLFGGLGANPPSWAIAGATLAVAALFQPARRRIQQAVDRRFNRRKYDAATTIEAFSARLRNEVDLDTLSAELLAVVYQTMEPTRVSLWLRPSPHGSSGTRRTEARPTTWAY
jgi:hypothetical protein